MSYCMNGRPAMERMVRRCILTPWRDRQIVMGGLVCEAVCFEAYIPSLVIRLLRMGTRAVLVN